MEDRVSLYELSRGELTDFIVGKGLNGVHAALVWRYLYWDYCDSIGKMADLPLRVRAMLEAETRVGSLPVAREIQSGDGHTRKFLMTLNEGRVIETVLMRFTGRTTACVSSQAGCAMGCVFCVTGQMGFERNLTAGEIVAQAVHVAREVRRSGQTSAQGGAAATPGGVHRLRNVVLMGMGEPLHNYEAVVKAVDILRDPNGLSLGAERITLSTVGVIPGILRLAAERRPVHLAVSLHAATQEERAALVPVARKWPLGELMEACRTYSETTGRRIFYEWTLIEGRNDSPESAHSVGRLLKGLRAQVNLIPLNPTAGYGGAPSRTEAAKRFQEILAREYSLPSTVRQRRGIDIAAGCGQLAGAPV